MLGFSNTCPSRAGAIPRIAEIDPIKIPQRAN
jgi:hypothetical protein